ncbi:SulP family inorganic anion transporter [Alkalibacter saccharofermentans]|uniref:Sulfate permease, SulP family n=1 Tax=Alkalibacter saccharofermentans DSM 14828 TaxID=1120975 RepID=A0A1M4SJ12_9FIRM|nr:SulP family inorganic anion transporter [Alkalibacter saccharofermentans]SHE32169.1 sulfate permease, SulP family [Alkalibacter saccharofermentans DSM 14828]
MFRPKLFTLISTKNPSLNKNQITKDIVSGIIVAIIALPLSIALGIASGVEPEKGLITAVIAGFLISFLGGSRVQIGGPTGAFVIIVYGVIAQFGIEGLTIATIMAGVFMILFGLMQFGSIIRYIPYPITTGFTSGIAVVLFSTQVKDFLGLEIVNVPSEFFEKWHSYISNIHTLSLPTVSVGLLSLLIIVLWPKINKTIPGSLIALVISTGIVAAFNLPVLTIGDHFGEISSKITLIDLTAIEISIPIIRNLIPPALTIAFLASIESLLSAVVADGMIGKKHRSNTELIAQGIANIGSAVFGGIPATGAIARTAANVKNGGRTPIAGIVHALFLLLIMQIFMPLAKLIPMTSLGAILLVVAYNMSEWRSFKGLLRSTKSDVTVLLLTFILTVVFDLIIAIQIGMLAAMFLFIRRMADSTQVANTALMYKNILDDEHDENMETDSTSHDYLGSKILVYDINGPLFFGAANTFLDILNELKTHTEFLILKMNNVPNMDATALDALKRIHKRCVKEKTALYYCGVNEQPLKILRVSGYIDDVGEYNFFDDVKDAVKSAALKVSNL